MNKAVHGVYAFSLVMASATVFVIYRSRNDFSARTKIGRPVTSDGVTRQRHVDVTGDATAAVGIMESGGMDFVGDGYSEPPNPDNWQVVIPHIMYVYSAYVSIWSAAITEVHVLGALRLDYLRNGGLLTSYCKLWDVEGDDVKPEEYISRVINITETLNRKTVLNSVEFICHFKVPPKIMNGAVVSIITDNNSTRTNSMWLHNNINKASVYNFTLCLGRPLYGQMPASKFLEWIEINRQFGAQSILLHNDSFSSSLDPYVNHYVQTGLVRVLPWNFPADSSVGDPDELSYYLQETMLMDCLYRLQHVSRFMAVCDLDELLVPRHAADYSWRDMVERANCTDDVIGFGARHMLFSEQYAETRSPASPENADTIFDMTMRTSVVSAYYKRAKYIADTFRTVTVSIHNIPEGVGDPVCVLSIGVGALHHYRQTIPSPRFKVTEKNPLVKDETLSKYRKTVLRSIRDTMELIRQRSTSA